MPCNHEFLEHNLHAVLNDTLNPGQQTLLQFCLKECEQCRVVLDQARQYRSLNHDWQQQHPGQWNRKLFPMRPSRPAFGWWQWATLATSAFALVLVLLNTRIVIDDGMQITFGANTEAELQSVLARELSLSQEQYRLATEALLQNVVTSQNSQQELLVSALLDQTRRERSAEYSLLYSTLQNQRLSDQQYVNQRLNRLTDNQIESNQYLNTLATAVSTTTTER